MNGWRTLVLVGMCCGTAASLVGCSAIDKAAREKFIREAGTSSVTVFPAYVRQGTDAVYNAGAARTIAAAFEQAGVGEAVAGAAEVPLTSEWGMNQSKMYRDSLADFQAYLAEHPVETDYAFLPEYLINHHGTVMGVHGYLVSADGKAAFGVGLNSHHEIFEDVDPENVADCTTMVCRKIAQELGGGGDGQASGAASSDP
jgi:hypothetical protein